MSHKDQKEELASEVNEEKFIKIGSENNIEHTSIGSFSKCPFPVIGRIYGKNQRLFVPLVCRSSENGNAVNCWFIVATGSPLTYLTKTSLEAIIGKEVTQDIHTLSIQDETSNIECHVSNGRISNMNILGANALRALKLSIDFNWKENKFQLVRN